MAVGSEVGVLVGLRVADGVNTTEVGQGVAVGGIRVAVGGIDVAVGGSGVDVGVLVAVGALIVASCASSSERVCVATIFSVGVVSGLPQAASSSKLRAAVITRRIVSPGFRN